jgi:2,3-bisphosphoglycerate-dependent phosphoglycerate mutase
MPIEIIYETHSTTEHNERGFASGWLDGRLSEAGREQAFELGVRRRDDGIAAVFSSDLGRARETVEIAFASSDVPVLLDWRLRECDYGALNGAPVAEVHSERRRHLEQPYPGGESWSEAVGRVGLFLGDLPRRWEGTTVLVIGHVATRWGLDHWINGVPLEDLVSSDFSWQPGWEYRLA